MDAVGLVPGFAFDGRLGRGRGAAEGGIKGVGPKPHHANPRRE